jgi:diguanylate cyclase (GGDEF)-like protein
VADSGQDDGGLRLSRRSVGRLRREGGALLLTAATAGAAMLAYLAGIEGVVSVSSPFVLPWWVAFTLSVIVELFLVRIRFARETLAFALSDTVLVLLLFLVPPDQLITSLLLGRLLGRILFHRVILREGYPPLKLLFDTASAFLEAVIALLAFMPVVRLGDPLGPAGWLAAYWATLSTSVVMGILLEVDQIIDGVRPSLRRLREDLAFSIGVALPTTSVALIGVTVLWREPAAAWLLLVLIGLLTIGYRAYTAQLPRQDTLTYLYDTARGLQVTDEPDRALLAVLEGARELLRAAVVELALMPRQPGAPALRTVCGPGNREAVMEPVSAEVDLALWRAAIAEGRPLALGDRRDPPALAGALAAAGVRQAMTAPLPGRERGTGVLVVRGRAGAASAFDSDELQLLETLANHLSVALERSRLVRDLETSLERIHHQAVHDDLTRLPNRALLRTRINEALAGVAERPFAVLLIDLDGFKQVNDSLGHAAGDELLVIVAERLRNCLRPGDTPARLGGDEFAVLLAGTGYLDEVRAVADRLIASVSEPIHLHGDQDTRAEVGASVGAVVWDGHASVDDVLRDADAAMYAAKAAGKGRMTVFEPVLRATNEERLALEAGLRRAVEDGAVTAVYRPVVAANTGRVVAVGAAPVWPRPGGRDLAGAELRELAERAGVTVQLGRRLREQACADLRGWRAELDGRSRISVSVPCAIDELGRPGLSGEIGQLLAEAGLSPQHLELEVAGADLVTAPPAAIGGLHTLAGLGVHLSASGFGAGSVSLAHLSHLPVTALKLDASTVAALSGGPEESAVARALVRLALSSELPVVADGVAEEAQLEALRALRCTFVQGPLTGPPLVAGEVPGFVLLAAGARADRPA